MIQDMATAAMECE